MTAQEVEKQIAAMRRVRDEVCKSKESALKFLVDAGICTPSGKLTKPYRPSDSGDDD